MQAVGIVVDVMAQRDDQGFPLLLNDQTPGFKAMVVGHVAATASFQLAVGPGAAKREQLLKDQVGKTLSARRDACKNAKPEHIKKCKARQANYADKTPVQLDEQLRGAYVRVGVGVGGGSPSGAVVLQRQRQWQRPPPSAHPLLPTRCCAHAHTRTISRAKHTRAHTPHALARYTAAELKGLDARNIAGSKLRRPVTEVRLGSVCVCVCESRG